MTARIPAIVLLNPRARAGRGVELWESTKESLSPHLDAGMVSLDDDGSWERDLQRSVAAGVQTYIAAGGDGTVHALINTLFGSEAEQTVVERQLTIGAVGLGSSNDFHKPFMFSKTLPLKLSLDGARARDVGRAVLYNGDSEPSVRYFIVSASVGATAEGNAYFNSGQGMVGKVKGRSPSLAIAGAVIRTIATHRPVRAQFIGGPPGLSDCLLSNLNILKVPYVSGTLHYDLPVEPSDGLLTAAAWLDMGSLELVSTIASLARGRYKESPKRLQWKAPAIELAMETVGAVELDGEIYEADRVRFEVLPNAVRECQASP